MKLSRQIRIIELINEYSIETQEELIQRLRDSGFNVTQATVSRDIKELRLLKSLSPDGKYRYTSISKSVNDVKSGLHSFFKNSVVAVKEAQNMIVIKTMPGMAQAVCASIDTVGYDEIVGTIAGDDTIFIVCPDNETAHSLIFDLNKFI